jgi:hypothetical protein
MYASTESCIELKILILWVLPSSLPLGIIPTSPQVQCPKILFASLTKRLFPHPLSIAPCVSASGTGTISIRLRYISLSKIFLILYFLEIFKSSFKSSAFIERKALLIAWLKKFSTKTLSCIVFWLLLSINGFSIFINSLFCSFPLSL